MGDIALPGDKPLYPTAWGESYKAGWDWSELTDADAVSAWAGLPSTPPSQGNNQGGGMMVRSQASTAAGQLSQVPPWQPGLYRLRITSFLYTNPAPFNGVPVIYKGLWSTFWIEGPGGIEAAVLAPADEDEPVKVTAAPAQTPAQTVTKAQTPTRKVKRTKRLVGVSR